MNCREVTAAVSDNESNTMGSLRKMLKNRLPALATLWLASGTPSEEDDDLNAGAELQTVATSSPFSDPADPSYSRPDKLPDSTYELMRECPEIIEEVVERRYNTGTIVRPHLRHGLARLSVQNMFEEDDMNARQTAENPPTESNVEGSGKLTDGGTSEVTVELTGESTSDIGMSSGKDSDAGDTYAVPKGEAYEVPRGAVDRPVAGQDAVGDPEVGREEESEDRERWSREGLGQPSLDCDEPYGPAHGDGCYVQCVRDPPDENVYLKPKTVEEIECDKLKVFNDSMTESTGTWHDTVLELLSGYPSDTSGERSHRNGLVVAGGQPANSIASTVLRRTRSLQNLQHCLIEIHATESTITFGGNSGVELKHETKKDYRQPIEPGGHYFSDNFVLQPSRQFETYSQGLRSSSSPRSSVRSSAAVWDAGRQPWEAASPAPSEDTPQVNSRDSTLEREYERLPIASAEVSSPHPSEPLYANSSELQQLLLQQLREQTEPVVPASQDTSSAAKIDIDPEVVPIVPRGKRRRRVRVLAPQRGDQSPETHPENPDAPSSPVEAQLALKMKDSKFACVRIKPAIPGRGTLRKSSSMGNIGPVFFTPPPAAPAHFSDHPRRSIIVDAPAEPARDEKHPVPPDPTSASPQSSVWLALAVVWMTVRGLAGATGRALARVTAPITDWLGVQYMSFHRNHPWLPDLVNQQDLDYWVQSTKQGSNGFEELRKYIKQGSDFCKDLTAIIQERSDLEVSYARGLQKLAAKLLNASRSGQGSVNQAWQRVGTEMEHRADVHKTLAVTYTEELVKPLRALLESHHKVRRAVESTVDKTAKNLAEWRSVEARAKKLSYQCARENERVQDQALKARLAHGSGNTEAGKVQSRRQKTENALANADADYYNFCLRSERARLEWETALDEGSHCFQRLEEERLIRLRAALQAYHHSLAGLAPSIAQSASRLSEPVSGADVSQDMQTVLQLKRPNQPADQMLPDFYAEDMTNAMNRDRRKKALEQFARLLEQDVRRERRGKSGVENLAKAMQQSPHFSSESSQKDVKEKLQHLQSMLTYLEASRYKVQASLAETEGQIRPQHSLSRHIRHQKDRQGMVQSVLKVPSWVTSQPSEASPPDRSSDWPDCPDRDRGRADGTPHQAYSDTDEFSSEDSPCEGILASPQAADPDINHLAGSLKAASPPVRYQAIYDYRANMNDELTIRAGDVIEVQSRQPDGWWLGELGGTVGIFPATYVRRLI